MTDRDTTAPPPALRCAAVWLGVGVAVLGLGALVLPDLTEARAALVDGTWQTRSFETLLGWTAATAAVVALAWLWVVSGLVVLDAARGIGRDRPGCPAPLRRLLLAACGAAVTGSLVAGMTLPASADPLPRPVPVSGSLAGAAGLGQQDDVADVDPGPDLHGLPLPDRARSAPLTEDRQDDDAARGPRGRATPRTPVRPAADVHVVRPGDTLWDLARDQLADRGPLDPSDAEIDARWRAIWAANADVVGSDPDLILPGQRLQPPDQTERPDPDRFRD